MKRTILMICSAVIFMSATTVNAAIEAKALYYQSMSSMSHNHATYTFVLDELLTARCGKAPSINYLGTLSDRELLISIALKDGNITEARSLIASIPCGK